MAVIERFSFNEYIIKFSGNKVDECVSFVYDSISDQEIRKTQLSMRDGIQLRDMHLNKKWISLFASNIQLIYDASYDWIQNSFSIEKSNPITLGIDSMWINYSPPGAYNVLHHHPKSNISGVFYLKSNELSGDIVFPHPFPHEFAASPTHRVCPEENTGLIFYSGLQHFVDVNRSTEDRISVSFNILVSSKNHQIKK